MSVTLPRDYRPTESEPFMNAKQRKYFRQKLLRWREDLLQETFEALQHLQEGGLQEPDFADRATLETDHYLELRTRDRARKLIAKIDEALGRLEDGSYGYCEETNEAISVRRLEARPIATLRRLLKLLINNDFACFCRGSLVVLAAGRRDSYTPRRIFPVLSAV